MIGPVTYQDALWPTLTTPQREMATLRAVLRSCRAAVRLDRAGVLRTTQAWLRELPAPRLP